MNAMNEGISRAQQRQNVEAVEKLQEAVAIDPTNEDAFYQLAQVLISMERWEEAKDNLQRAISLNPERAYYHYQLGSVLMKLEQFQAAIDAFGAALGKDESLAKAHYKAAQAHERLEQPQEALTEYTQAIEKGPRFLEAYSQLGRLYANLGFLAEAVQVLQSALQVALEGTKEKAQVYHLLGTIYQQQRNLEGAIREFRAALEIEPSMPSALFSLGWAYDQTGDRDEARRYLSRFIQSADENVPQHYVGAAQGRLNELGEAP